MLPPDCPSDLFAANLHLVASVIARGHVFPTAVMDIDDLQAVGLAGLHRASESFDSNRPGGFVAYARLRIRGAILDEARAMDSLSRTHRAAVKEGRASEPEVFSSDSEAWQESGGPGEDPARSPAEAAQESDDARCLRALIHRLPLRYRDALRNYWGETLASIAARRGVTEGAVCQILHLAVRRLRAMWPDSGRVTSTGKTLARLLGGSIV